MNELDNFRLEPESGNSRVRAMNLFCTICLFILIFFVLFDSMTKRNSKNTQKALQNIKSTFTGDKGNKLGDIDEYQIERIDVMVKYYRETFNKIMQDLSVPIPPNPADDKNIYRANMPVAAFFYQETPRIEAKYQTMLEDIISVFKTGLNRKSLLLEILVSNNEFDRNPKLLNQRLINVKKFLNSHNISDDQIKIGTYNNQESQMLFSFYY